MTRVLYADDDPQVAEIVAFNFSQTPATELTVVHSGRGCLDTMAGGGFDLLLLDLKMPDLDGLQVLGELSARGDSTPVIMVSGHGQADLAVRALRAGAVDCIDKNGPDFHRLPAIVGTTLDRSLRRPRLLPSASRPASHRVLYLDPDPDERRATAKYFSDHAPRLALTALPPGALNGYLQGESSYAAVVLGPNLARTPALDALRQLRSSDDALPVILLAGDQTGETAIAAFKLGAHDFLLHGPGCLTELVFSLSHAIQQSATARLAEQLGDDLAALNRTLAAQVAARTRELESEVAVRRAAEARAAAQAERSQALATRLLRVQETERASLAQELHDQVGQLLTGLRFQLESARTRPTAANLDEALSVTDDLLRSVRTLALQLRPRVLDDLGLRPALDWHLGNFRRQTGLEVEFELTLPAARLPHALEYAIYRVVQEALTNVARHSGASQATVTVTADDTILHVEISDRGCGFDAPAALARRDSLGLAGMAERVALSGGRFEVFSQPGQGTRIHGEFDLPSPS